jgi:cytochrome b561
MQNIRCTKVAAGLHWLVAALVIVQIGLGFASDWSERPLSELFTNQHVRVGILIFMLMLLRISWRLGHRPPPLPSRIPAWQRQSAGAVHWLLYLLLLAMPVSGYVLWAWSGKSLSFWGVGLMPILFTGGEDEFWRSVAGYAHEYGAYAITALVLIHIAAALHHQFIAKDMTIGERMGFGPLDGDAGAD